MGLFGVTALPIEVFAGGVLALPFWALLFQISDFIIVTWCPPNSFLNTPLSGNHQKCLQLGPALPEAGLPSNYIFTNVTLSNRMPNIFVRLDQLPIKKSFPYSICYCDVATKFNSGSCYTNQQNEQLWLWQDALMYGKESFSFVGSHPNW